MRFRLPHFLRLLLNLLALFLLLTSMTSYGVQTTHPIPLCLLYTESAGAGYYSKIVDPRSGQMWYVDERYYSTLDMPHNIKDVSPTGNAFSMLSGSPYAAPDRLYVGVPGSTRLNLVAHDWYISSGWSPDGSELAYIYHDQSTVHVVIADAAGNHRRIQALNGIKDSGITYFAGWSADGKYLAMMKYLDEHMAAYYFVAAETLRPVPTSVSTYFDDYQVNNGLVWSPQGHRFAYIDDEVEPRQLIIATPEGGIENRFALHRDEVGVIQLPLAWSPDGRYVALHGYTTDKQLFNDGKGPVWDYWSYTIFGVDGSIRAAIKGQKLYPLQDPPDGWWSADGTTWFFRQQPYNPDVEDVLSYIMAYQIKTGSYQILVDHVAGSPLFLEGGNWFAVLVWNANAAKLNLAFVSIDGVQKRIIDRDFDEIVDMRWLDDKQALAVVGRHDDSFTFEIIDLYTGESEIKIEGLPKQSFAQIQGVWPPVQRLTPAPSGQHVILKVGELKHQSLILISLASKRLQPLLMEGYTIGNVYWAADGSAFAFIQHDSVKTVDTLHIVSADGDTLNQIALLPRGNNILAGWTWCR